MGTLGLPASGLVYVDTSPIIYGLEKHPRFYQAWEPLWEAVELGQLKLATSGLTLMECLVLPLKQNNTALINLFEQTLLASDISLMPVTTDILRAAVRLRADANLKTPDAIHAATALATGYTQFITNDVVFRRVAGLSVIVLHEIF